MQIGEFNFKVMEGENILYSPYGASNEDLKGHFADSIMLTANWPDHTTIDFYITVIVDNGLGQSVKKRVLVSRVHLSPTSLGNLRNLIIELDNKIKNPTLKQTIGGEPTGA